MKKFTAYLIAALCLVALAACSSSGEGGLDYNSPDYGQLTVTHSNSNFDNPPMFTPNADITGTISWSDGVTEEWEKNAEHTYEGEGPYLVTYELWKAQTVQFDNLEDLIEVDFSKF